MVAERLGVEVPLPPPEKPERRERRSPEYERASIAVGAASVWAADVHARARDLAGRRGSEVAVTIELDGGERVEVRELRAGPGEGFVTLGLGDERELAVRLDRIARVDLTPTSDRARAFRPRGGAVGFGGD
jgi:hypothetical protein